jgi:hypothetical protein
VAPDDGVTPAGDGTLYVVPGVVQAYPASMSPPPAARGAGWVTPDVTPADVQASRDHQHRERVVQELTAQAEALAEAVRAARQAGAVSARPGSGHAEQANAAREDRSDPDNAEKNEKKKGAKRKTARPASPQAVRPPASAVAESPSELPDAHARRSKGTQTPGPLEPAEKLDYESLSEGDADLAFVDAEDPQPITPVVEGEPASAHRMATVQAREARQRPAPLALWAQREHHHAARRRATRAAAGDKSAAAGPALDDLQALLKDLNIPAALAETGYAAGCRIRRIRIRRRTGPRPVEKDAPVVILSRRALERLRPVLQKRPAPERAAARG